MSILNGKYKFIYIHIPKTGGTSIESVGWMGTKTNQHHGIKEYQRLLANDKRDLNSFFKWTIIRDPYTAFATGILNHELAHIKKPSLDEFRDYAFKSMDFIEGMTVISPQVSFLKDYQGRIRMDYIGTFEKLQQSFDKVCTLLGINPTELPYINKGKKQNYDYYLTDEIRELVRKYYKEDFELYNKVTGKVVIPMEELKEARLEELLAKEADESMGLGEDELRELNELKAAKEAEEAPEEAPAEEPEAEEEAEESEEEAEEEPAEE
jgi:hypothetical protein